LNYFNEYLNYHRPCAFAIEIADAKKKGKIRKVYRQQDYQTPYEKLKSLENAQQYLKKNTTLGQLYKIAIRITDNEMAKLVQAQLLDLNENILKKVFANKSQQSQYLQKLG